MTEQSNQPISLATAVADFLFRISTSSLRPQSLWPAGRIPVLDQWAAGGGTLRSASAKRFAIRSADTVRMRRSNCVVLPAPWLCLAEDEITALTFAQLRKIHPAIAERPMFSNALAHARFRLRLDSMRGDGPAVGLELQAT